MTGIALRLQLIGLVMALSVCVSGRAATAANRRYVVIDLGKGLPVYTFPVAVNDRHQVLAWSISPKDEVTSVLLTNGNVSVIGQPGSALEVHARAFGSDGAVVGDLTGKDPLYPSTNRAFVWLRGHLSLLPLPTGHSRSGTIACTDQNRVLGWSAAARNGSGMACLWIHRVPHLVDGVRLCLGAADQSAGYRQVADRQRATLWKGSHRQDVSRLLPRGNSRVIAIGPNSTAAGIWNEGRYSAPFTYVQKRIIIGPRLQRMDVRAMDARGDVLCNSIQMVNGIVRIRPYIWDGKTMVDVNDLLVPGQHWTIGELSGMTPKGLLVGEGVSSDGLRPVLLESRTPG